MAEINGIKVPFVPIVPESRPGQSGQVEMPGSFGQFLQKEIDSLKFSKHAAQRLEARSITLSPDQLSRIESAISKADQKGAKDSLVLLDDTAFIVNIPNRTVVTAMEVGNNNENVFTNIDSVVIT